MFRALRGGLARGRSGDRRLGFGIYCAACARQGQLRQKRLFSYGEPPALPTDPDFAISQTEQQPGTGDVMARLATRPALLSLAARCLDNLLPRHCVLCGLPGGPGNLCPACRADLPRPGNVCTACALPVGNSVDTVCGQCLHKPPPWDRVEAALVYRFPVDQLVCRFKFGRDFACGHLLGREMLDAIFSANLQMPDLLAPVPLHRLRHASRTFNQADLLARQVGRGLGVPVHSSLMSRVRRTRAQSGLDAADRKRNTRGAFRCRRRAAQALAGRHVALVDDVMTTGATLLECTRTLRRSGVARVSLWVAARAPAC